MLRQISGFTLIEVIASLVLLGLLTAIFGLGLVAATQSFEFSRVNVQMAQKGQLAMARITRELAQLTQVEAVSTASSGQDPYIIYRRMTDDDTQPAGRFAIHFNTTDQTVRIYSNLKVGPPLDDSTKGQSDILVDGVGSFALNYFSGSSDWNWGADPRLLSSIGIGLRLRRPDHPAVTQDFNTTVFLRNTDNYGGAAFTRNPVSRNDYSCFIATALGKTPVLQRWEKYSTVPPERRE